jgi:hypothetical protein
MVDYKRLKRLLSQIVVVGKTKKTLFRKSKDFELQIYYTPVKNKIMIINIEGVKLDHPNLDFKIVIGDNIDLVFTWVEQNKHEITFLRNRLEN